MAKKLKKKPLYSDKEIVKAIDGYRDDLNLWIERAAEHGLTVTVDTMEMQLIGINEHPIINTKIVRRIG